MFGKHFASMYTGSMFGKPATVFAVWGYAISNLRPSRKDGSCHVEMNPTLLAATFASTVPEIIEAIRTLCEPDPASRSDTEDGRRLVTEGEIHAGPMNFLVVNGSKYREMRDEEERRAYLREAKRKQRSTKLLTVNHGQPPSTQVDVEEEEDVEERGTPTSKSKEASSPKRTESTPPDASPFTEGSIPFPENLKTEGFLKSWQAWKAYRRESKFPQPVESTVKSLFAKMSEWGPEKAARCIQQSIDHGWRGIFEEKANGASKSQESRRKVGSSPDREEGFANAGKDRVIDMDKFLG